MLMMGILILSYPFPPSAYLSANEFVKYMFGGLLIVYGVFRGYNAYIKLKQKPRKLHYYDREDED